MGPRLGLSRQKHLPVVKLGKSTFSPLSYLGFRLRGWSFTQFDPDTVRVRHKQTTMELSTATACLLLSEWTVWCRNLLPGFSLKGKVVMDVGAGEGETAYFFFLQGASKVVAIESNDSKFERLTQNVQYNGWPCYARHESFRLEHLEIPHEYLKVDIEGGEAALLDLDSPPTPSFIEVHGKDLLKAFEKKFGVQDVSLFRPDVFFIRYR